MRSYEKKSFIQIFLGYFISVTIFILLLGFLYFNQQKTFVMQKTAMNMHQYITKVKQSNFLYKKEGYIYKREYSEVKKQLPQKRGNIYYKVFSNHFQVMIDAKIVDAELKNIKNFTIILQLFLIILFAFISFLLAKKSLKPMVDTVSHLDRFIKDLVHDLNTPVTSILLNTKMLKKDANENSIKKIIRIENSAKNISSLYANLELLLNEQNLIKDSFNISILINNLIETYKLIYPNIKFDFLTDETEIYSNQNAIKRVVDNILSNSCKYSKESNPTINIIYKNSTLIIKDNGKGIKYPKKIFERSYKENSSGHGIGMHIVYRLCHELSHSIDIESKENSGTVVTIRF